METIKFQSYYNLSFSPKSLPKPSINNRHINTKMHAIQYSHVI